MADGSEIESGLLMEVTTAPSTLSQAAPVQIVSVTDGHVSVPNEGQVAEDILQQAFVGAEDFTPNTVEYTSGETVEDASVAAEIVNNVIAEDSLVTNVTDSVPETTTFAGVEYGVVGTESEVGSGEVALVEEGEENGMVQSNGNTVSVTSVMEQTEPDSTNQPVVASSQQAQAGSVSVAVIPGTGPNLGSSHNPIRIIQQGNQYTPVQQLTAEQLQQIMQVVQQQQLAKSTSQGGGSSVLFNPQTNTRIVYRVIYPSELHKGGTAVVTTSTVSQGQQDLLGSHHKRPYRRRVREDEDDKVEGPELSKEEKEERKKHRPRTRSGRVSKPPKHMMKDYKHIHVLDWDEDYDDSDGGYSDYKCSDEEKRRNEEGEALEKEEATYVYPGLGSTRPKNYKCDTCEKAYIGQAGLSRHYRLNPSHGSIPEGEQEDDRSQDGSGRTNGNIGSLSEDSNTQDSIPGLGVVGTGTPSPVAKRGNIHSSRGRGRGRHLHELSLSRRKAKLKEIVRQCEDEDLMEIVLPRLAKVITLWEFLLMKVEKGYPSRPHVDDIYREFEALHKQVQKVCQLYLSPRNKDKSESNSTQSLQVENVQLAQALGLEVGMFDVKEMPAEETPTFLFKQTPETISSPSKPMPVRRKIQVTTPDQTPGLSAAKRPRTVSVLSDSSPVKNNSATSTSILKGTQNVQFRVVSASSSAASLTTPHIIAVSNPHSVLANNNNTASASRFVTVSNPNIVTVSNPNIVTVSNPNIVTMSNPNMVTVSKPSNTASSVPHVVALSNSSIVSHPQILTVSNANVSGSNITTVQPKTVVRPPESSVQTTSQVGGVSKSHEILTSQAATSTMLSSTTETVVAVESDSVSVVDTMNQNIMSAVNSANLVINSNGSGVSSASNSIESAPNGEPVTLRTILVNGGVTNDGGVKQLQPLQEALQTNIQNIQVVESLEEAQQLILAQSQMNGVEPSSNIATLAEVVHNESEFIEQTIEGDVKREIVLNPVEAKSEEVDPGEVQGQVVSAEQIEGQVISQDQIVTHSNIYQTEDGILIIQNPDGTTFQLQGAEGIPLETVQALLAMEGQFEGGEAVQAELQQ
ncbi:uncharacterized protein [Haliotis asinina]|uniref:uncharacterized protein n=1 Tax=Haliotis asinina TaxID=109174 RepID=UPI0035319752